MLQIAVLLGHAGGEAWAPQRSPSRPTGRPPPSSSFLQNEGRHCCAWDERRACDGEVGSGGTKGPGFLSSSLVIKSSKCQPEPHSPAAPRGRMKRGFHGYHLRKRIFRSNQSQRFTQ